MSGNIPHRSTVHVLKEVKKVSSSVRKEKDAPNFHFRNLPLNPAAALNPENTNRIRHRAKKSYSETEINRVRNCKLRMDCATSL